MANSGKVEAECESEPEDSVLLRRRRAASDDDNDVEEEESKIAVRLNRSARRIGYSDESDSGDGAPEYYENDSDEEVSYVDELERLGEEVEEEREDEVAEQVTATTHRGKEKVNDADKDALAVPRTGAFYMHDDRFGGLPRRSRDQRRKKYTWESKEKWMHDKFEEMTLEETHNKELNAFEVRRTSKDYHQGHDHNNTKSSSYKAEESRLHSRSGNKGSLARTVKGRGPVRYKPLSMSGYVNSSMKSMQWEKTQGMSYKTDSARVFSANNKQHIYKRSPGKTSNADSQRALSTKCKQPAKPFEMTGDTDSSTAFSTKSKLSGDLGMVSYTDSASVSLHGLNADCDSLPFDQHFLAPKMSSYLQAFYPASFYHHDNSETQKRVVLPGSRNVVFPASVLPNQNIHVPQSNKFLQGNITLDIPYAEGVSPATENYFIKRSVLYSVPGSTYMASPEHPIVPQMPVESTVQPPSQLFAQQLHSPLGSGSPKLFEASSLSFYEPGILESLTGSIQSKVASLGTGSNIVLPPQYTGVQGDQDFNAIPFLFPAMQIGALHHGRLGDPAIDMTSTGYNGESQVHFSNPDLTWLPPAAAGAVGATCRPSCVAPDGSCYGTTMPFVDNASYARCTIIPSNEASTSGPSNSSLQSSETDYVKQTAEQVNNECGIQQFKPTRYSRMNMKK